MSIGMNTDKEATRQTGKSGDSFLSRLPDPIACKVFYTVLKNEPGSSEKLSTLSERRFAETISCLQGILEREARVKDFARLKLFPLSVVRSNELGENSSFLDPQMQLEYSLYMENYIAKTQDTFLPKYCKQPQKSFERTARDYFWLKENFPETYTEVQWTEMRQKIEKGGGKIPGHFSELVEKRDSVVRVRLTKNFKYLAIGAGRTGENDRSHSPKTTYTINLNGSGDPHVNDNIALLPQRSYLDIQGRPHQFEVIYIEVSCGNDLFFYPEMFNFLNKHLVDGGHLVVEFDLAFLNESIGCDKNNPVSGSVVGYPVNPQEIALFSNRSLTLNTGVETMDYTFSSDEEGECLNQRQSFSGDLKKYFEKLGFRDIQLDTVTKPCQLLTRPVRMTKNAKV